jgi:hypothetical protein
MTGHRLPLRIIRADPDLDPELRSGAPGRGASLVLDLDGATGRGHLDLVQTFQLRRGEDHPDVAGGAAGPARVYAITPSRGPRSELVTDADGWPLELSIRDHGELLRLRRRPESSQ